MSHFVLGVEGSQHGKIKFRIYVHVHHLMELCEIATQRLHFWEKTSYTCTDM